MNSPKTSMVQTCSVNRFNRRPGRPWRLLLAAHLKALGVEGQGIHQRNLRGLQLHGLQMTINIMINMMMMYIVICTIYI